MAHVPLPDDPLALDRQVCFAVVVAARSVVSVYRPVLEPLGLTHPQYLVLLALWEREPLSAGELSGLLALDPGTLSPLIKRLETAGLLTRRRSAADERRLEITLTTAGRALRAQAEKVPGAVLERLGMSVDELTALRDSLSRFIRTARDVDEERPTGTD